MHHPRGSWISVCEAGRIKPAETGSSIWLNTHNLTIDVILVADQTEVNTSVTAFSIIFVDYRKE